MLILGVHNPSILIISILLIKCYGTLMCARDVIFARILNDRTYINVIGFIPFYNFWAHAVSCCT